MTKQEAGKLAHGLYEVFWKSGGSSLAAVGSLHNGDRWLAPCNWTMEQKIFFDASHWRSVEKVNLIKSKM
jgi:hypothetical protein